jgi:hypothetical protein
VINTVASNPGSATSNRGWEMANRNLTVHLL